jgi:hypothetical protein
MPVDETEAAAPAEVAFEDAAPPPVPEKEAKPAEPAAPKVKKKREKRPRRAVSGFARAAVWLSFGFLVAAIIAGAYRYRQIVVDEWPAATVIYETVGISVTPPPGYSFNIAREKLQLEFQGDGIARRLVVRGEIRNISKRPRPAPRIQMFLQNDSGKELKRHDFLVAQGPVGPGQSAKFTTSIANPPVAATKIRLRMRYPTTHDGASDRRARPFAGTSGKR